MLKNSTLDVREIYPLTDFLRSSKDHIARLKKTGGPEVLTVNGKAEVIIEFTSIAPTGHAPNHLKYQCLVLWR